MKNCSLAKNYLLLIAGALSGLSLLNAQAPTTQTFNFTGSSQTFTVPSCVSTISITAYGAQGQSNANNAVVGGLGGSASGVLSVTPNQVLTIYVGGTTGYNGGGLAGTSTCTLAIGGNGGGASDVRVGGTALSNRVIVGAGGGGAGGDRISTCGRGTGGGGGGGYYGGGGGGGYATTSTSVPTGGTQTAGGSGGTGGLTGQNGSAGTLGSGGAGGTESSSNQAGANTALTGGAGGGLTGSSGQQPGSIIYVGQSGAGGSSYIASTLTNSSTTTGNRTGNGMVVLTYNFNGAGVLASASSLSICANMSATLTASNVTSYTWTPGGSNTSSIVVTPTVNASYTVSGTNTLGCISSAVLTLTVDPAIPSLSVANTASATSGICPTKTVALTASGATTYSWTGGTSPVTNGVAFAPTVTAIYTVSGANACGTSTAATSVSIHPFPTVGAVASTPSLCSGLSLTLTATGNASTYVWSGGVTNGAGFFPGTTNTYVVIGTSALSCTASASTVVTVVTTPSLTPTGSPISICIGKSSTLTATGATNYTWLPGNANTSSIVVSPTAVVNTYTLIKSNANCVDTKTISIFVNQLPNVFGIATPTLVCAGKPSTLAVGGAVTYTWTSPGPPSYTFTGASPVVSPPVTSIYTVAGTDANGCVNTATVLLATDPNPTVSIAVSSSVICKGQTVSMTASGGINYTWTSTSGTVFTASYSDTPTGATLYNVTADNSFSCTTTISQIVLVNPTPTINIAITKTLVCTGGPSTITASGANTYAWDANANNAITAGTVVNPVATTVYTVLGTYTATGCQSTKTIEVKVFTPTVTVTSPTNTCYGGNITLVASGANPNSYNWNTGSGFVNPFQTIAVTPTVFTIYTVSAVSGSNGVNCPSTQTTSIGIFYNPTITAIPQRTLFCRGESLNLYGNGGVSYSWSNSQTGATITVNPASNTNYTVTGTDANGCVNTGTIQVKVSNCTGIQELSGTASNGISIYPNPNTGAFNISSDADIKLNLINELGQLVRGIHLNATNSYKIDISDLSNGVYFMIGEKNGQTINQKIIVTK